MRTQRRYDLRARAIANHSLDELRRSTCIASRETTACGALYRSQSTRPGAREFAGYTPTRFCCEIVEACAAFSDSPSSRSLRLTRSAEAEGMRACCEVGKWRGNWDDHDRGMRSAGDISHARRLVRRRAFSAKGISWRRRGPSIPYQGQRTRCCRYEKGKVRPTVCSCW